MKTKHYILIGLFIFVTIALQAQQGITIQGGGAVTINGNLVIAPTSWSCGQPIIDSRDGKTYTTVQIGTQCWMAQNLNIGTRIAGSSNQTNNSIIEKYCYSNLESNCDIYGGLYQWDEAMQYSTTPGIQGICPTGWHLPSNDELETLITFLGGYSIAGGKMKSIGTIQTGTGLWISPNTGATNSSGFTGLPSGSRSTSGLFYYLANNASFWTSSQIPINVHSYWLGYNYEYIAISFELGKTNGFSARCLKD